MRHGTIFIFSLLLMLLAGLFITEYQTSPMLVMGIVGAGIFIIAFVSPELGLYILIFSMLLSPELRTGSTQGGSLGRGVTLRIEDFLLIVIGFSWFVRAAVYKELGLFRRTPLNKPILFYTLVCVLATGFGILGGRVSPGTGTLYVLKYIEFFIVFFMAVNNIRDEQQVKRFVFCLFMTCLIVSIIGIHAIPGEGRVSAPFEGDVGEPNTLGGYMVFIMAIVFGLFHRMKSIRARQLLLLLIVLMIPPFLFTQSRASYLGFIPMVFVLALMMEKRGIIIGALLILFILSPLLLPSEVKDRVLYTFNQPEEAGQIEFAGLRIDTSTSARLRNWGRAFHDWPNHPLLGYGVTGYAFVDAQFPRVLVETGLIGLAAFLWLLKAIFNAAVANYQKVNTPFAKGICMGYIAGFVALLVHSVGANTFIIVRIMEPFWFFTAIVCVLPMLEKEADCPPEVAREWSFQRLSAARSSGSFNWHSERRCAY